MPGDSTTCMAMSWSGSRIGTDLTRKRLSTIRVAPSRAPAGLSAAAPGSATPSTAGRRSAAGSTPATATMTWAFAWRGRVLGPLTLLPWRGNERLTLARQRAVEPSVRAGSGVERKPAYKAYDGFRDRLKDLSEAPEMVYLPGGTFQMGDSQGKGSENERPVHEVTLDAFALGRYPVTVGEYLRFADATKSHYPQWLEAGSEDHIEKGTNGAYRRVGMSPKNGQHPIVGISWHDAVAYCAWLSKQILRVAL